jgi:hypothetical protein
MKHVLLLGAGFSWNWGGWLASEVNGHLPTSPRLRADYHVLQVLSRTANKGSFEAALAEIQDDYEKSPTPENLAHLQNLQSAITAMFSDMEAGFAGRPDWEFCHTTEFKIARFLSGFDGVFTLNQDLLFERHYRDSDLALTRPRKWFGWRRPGIRSLIDYNQGLQHDVAKTTWTPLSPPFSIERSYQPYFRLHGSWNWWSANNEQLLVMGGNKAASIEGHPLLKWYHEQFEAYLAEPDSRLMIIGYGFTDPHINKEMVRASATNSTLSLFLVDPRGRPNQQGYRCRNLDTISKGHLCWGRG